MQIMFQKKSLAVCYDGEGFWIKNLLFDFLLHHGQYP